MARRQHLQSAHRRPCSAAGTTSSGCTTRLRGCSIIMAVAHEQSLRACVRKVASGIERGPLQTVTERRVTVSQSGRRAARRQRARERARSRSCGLYIIASGEAMADKPDHGTAPAVAPGPTWHMDTHMHVHVHVHVACTI